MSCAFCDRKIGDNEVYFDLNCRRHFGHATHQTLACPVSGCGVAIGEAAAVSLGKPVKTGLQIAATELEARERRKANNVARRSEPLKPPQRSAIGGFFSEVLRIAGRVTEASVPDEESGDPYALLRAKVPLDTMVAKHGFDITELINDHGVTIADFFENGYTMDNMCSAFGSRMNRQEGMDVLYFLGMTDEFITKLPQLSQVEVMRSRLGFSPDSLSEKLGYRFEPGAWTMPQMIEVGLTMSAVMRHGLRTQAEWHALKATARTNEDLRRFGVTPSLEAQLINDHTPVFAPVAVSRATTTPTIAPTAASTVTPSVSAGNRVPIAPFQPLPPPASYAKPKKAEVVTFVPPSAGPVLRPAVSSGPRLVDRGGERPVVLVLPTRK